MYITNFRNGSIVNKYNGKEGPSGITLHVMAVGESDWAVTFNGIPATREGRIFTGEVTLTEKMSPVEMKALHPALGELTQKIRLRWDRNSFKRYNFFIDDNIFFLTEIARERPGSLFDHFYLKFLKEMHTKYGTLFTLNLFAENNHSPFHIKDFPEVYKKEFEDNASWLKLSFHAYSEFPDRPYQNVPGTKLGEDYDFIKREILRFAGEESFIPPTALHWSMARPDGIAALRERGVKALSAQFYKPKSNQGEVGMEKELFDIGYFCSPEDCRYLGEKVLLHDFEADMTYFRSTVICNYYTPEEISEIVAKAAQEDRNGILALETHEQYSFPSYFNYIPDHFARIESAIRTATEKGYKPVFFAEGFLGNRG